MLMSWPPPPPQLQKIWRSFLEEKPIHASFISSANFGFIQLFGENLSKCLHFWKKIQNGHSWPWAFKYFRVRQVKNIQIRLK
jgi:hypothetical protein